MRLVVSPFACLAYYSMARNASRQAWSMHIRILSRMDYIRSGRIRLDYLKEKLGAHKLTQSVTQTAGGPAKPPAGSVKTAACPVRRQATNTLRYVWYIG